MTQKLAHGAKKTTQPDAAPVPVVLFDLDGTLADTAPDLITALKQMLIKRQMPIPAENKMRDLASHGSRHLIGLGLGIESSEVSEQLREEYFHYYEQGQQLNTRAFAGIHPLLTSIERQRMLWGIVTAKKQVFAEQTLRQLRIYPSCMVCPEHTEHPKPHPQPLLHALELLERSPEQALYIGDHPYDIQAGKAAGVATVGCGWGYGLTATDKDQCDFWAESPLDLMPLIEKFAQFANLTDTHR
ncbi:MAG: HAD family hydrolase [Gammaproteobacteria bacterium]